MSNIEPLIEGLSLKKAVVGGFDRESVYFSMQKLSSIYQEEINSLQAEKDKLQKELSQNSEALEYANGDIRLLKFQLEEEQKFRNDYNEKFNTLSQAIESVNFDKIRVIEDSKRIAKAIISEANEKLKRIELDCSLQQQKKEMVISEITDARQKFGIYIENLRSGLTEILSEVDTLKKDNAEQLADDTEHTDEESEIQSSYERYNKPTICYMSGCASENENR